MNDNDLLLNLNFYKSGRTKKNPLMSTFGYTNKKEFEQIKSRKSSQVDDPRLLRVNPFKDTIFKQKSEGRLP